MTSEQKADELASAFAAAESALAALVPKMRAFTQTAEGMGPITRLAFIRRAQGLEGDLAQLHVDITPFDPRPRPFDGGGK